MVLKYIFMLAKLGKGGIYQFHLYTLLFYIIYNKHYVIILLPLQEYLEDIKNDRSVIWCLYVIMNMRVVKCCLILRKEKTIRNGNVLLN